MVAGVAMNNYINGNSSFRKCMVIGVPTEIKSFEFRVGMTPQSCSEAISFGHTVIVQSGAGKGSGFDDMDYVKCGCTMVPKAEEVYSQAEMIVKVKEPLEQEYKLIRPGQIIFTYFHLAANKELTEAMIKSKAICIAYETVKKEDNSLPLLIPMSEIAGRMSIQEAAIYLEKPQGGSGILLSGIPGVKPGRVVILGGGIVGYNAAKAASGIGADVVIMDVNANRLRQLESMLPPNCKTLYSSKDNIAEEVKTADAVIGAVLIPGAQAPVLINRGMLKTMKKGCVIIDVAIDQGGCIETCVPTTHDNPTFVVDDIVHYCVANMPGAVPHTSTIALNNATSFFVNQLANFGWVEACRRNPELVHGLNVVQGQITCRAVAEAFAMEYTSPSEFIKNTNSEGINFKMARCAISK